MNKKKQLRMYEGFANRETWSVALVTDNDQEASELVKTACLDHLKFIDNEKEDLRAHFADWLRLTFEIAVSDFKDSSRFGVHSREALLASNLLKCALDRVDWIELANWYIDAYKEEAK